MTTPDRNPDDESLEERMAAAVDEVERLDLELRALQADRVLLETEAIILESTTEMSHRILRYLHRGEGEGIPELTDEERAFLLFIRDEP